MSQIICKNLTFAYDGHYVSGPLDFTVNAGDYLCIVGENGSGKSTLLKGILGLKEPASGSIITGDGLKPSEIGYLPQQSAIQKNFPASVYEVVLSGNLNSLGKRPFYGAAHKKNAIEKMELLGITDIKKRSYQELSGGQQQRVLLARALCATKRLLLLDEPVSGLDPKVTEEMYTVIQNINRKLGITIIMVSHDIQSALRFATHVLHIGHGSDDQFFGTCEDYLRSDLCRSFLGKEPVDISSILPHRCTRFHRFDGEAAEDENNTGTVHCGLCLDMINIKSDAFSAANASIDEEKEGDTDDK